MSSVDFDEVLKHIGERGRYQLTMYYLLCIPATVPAVFLAFSQVFVSAIPDHWCRLPTLEHPLAGSRRLTPEQQRSIGVPWSPAPDGSRHYDNCRMYDVNLTEWLATKNLSAAAEVPVADSSWPTVECRHGWLYDHRDYDRTLVTELNLVCDNRWRVSASTTLFYVGSLFGNVLFGWVADRFGRRPTFLIMLFCTVWISIITSFSPNYFVYTVLRTLNGFFFPSIFQIPFILVLEMMGPRYRTFAGIVICMFFAGSMSLLATLGYFLRDWFTLSLATSVPFLILFSYYWIVPESPRWLLSKNRVDEAEIIVQKMAKCNRRPIPPNFLRKLQEECQRLSSPSTSKTKEATPLDLVRYKNIRNKFLIIAFDWVANAVVYNGMIYNSSNYGVSDYLSFFIGGAVEIPSYFIAWWAMDRLGRRNVLCFCMFLGGFACVSCMFVPEGAIWGTVALAMVGRFNIAAAFAVFYIFVGELLPTVLRSQAMGIGSFIAGLGLLTFPTIIDLAKYSRVLPLIVMGSLSLAGAIISIFLPETLHRHMPQTLEDGERLKPNFPISSLSSKNRRGRPNGVSSEITSPPTVIVTDFDAENN